MILSISYDITDNKLRKKIADYLIRMGMIRMQKSMFCGFANRYDKEIIGNKLKEIHQRSENQSDKIMINVIRKDSMKNGNFIGEIDEEIIQELRGDIKVKIY